MKPASRANSDLRTDAIAAPRRPWGFVRAGFAAGAAVLGFGLALWLGKSSAAALAVGAVNALLMFAAVWLTSRQNSAPPIDSLADASAATQLLDGLNLAGEAAGVQAWDWDLTTNTLRFDRGLVDLFGWSDTQSTSPQELIEQAVFKDDYPHYRAEFIKALKGEAPLCINYRVIHKDGTVRPVQLRGQVFRGPDVDGQPGRAKRVVGITVDMRTQLAHEARAAELSQRQQELLERLSLATEVAGIGVWDWDLAQDGLGTDPNTATLLNEKKVSGIANARDFVAKLLHPEDRERFLAAMSKAVTQAGNERVTMAFRYLRKDGSTQHAELNGKIMRGDDGRARRFLGVSYNITAKMESQAEIERQAAAQRLLLERLNLATEVAGLDVWDWDLVSDRFTADAYMTKAYAGTHFDLPSGWQLLAQIVHPEDLEDYLDILNRTIASGNSFTYRYRILLPDGRKRHVQTQARVFRDEQGKAVRMLGVNIDKTEEVNHLDELRRQADGERALRDRLNLATQTAGISVWDKDLVSGAFSSDAQFWKMLGIAQPDAQFKPVDGIHPSVRDQAMAPINAALADPTKNEVLAIRHRTSNPRTERQFFQTHMRVFRDGYGKPVRILGVTWDVTHEVEHAEELERKAERERALLERLNMSTQAAGISPWEFDLKTNQMTWHGLTLPAYGFDNVPSERFMEELLKIVVEEDRPLLTEAGARAIKQGLENYVYHFRVHGADGKIHHIRNICKLVRNARGNYRYVMGVTMDVTAEVEAAERLQQQAELERALLNRLNVATQAAGISPWEFDLKINQFAWSGGRLGILGLDNVPLANYMDALRDVIVPEDRDVLRDAGADAIANGLDVYSYRYRARGVDGHIHHLKNYVRILRSDHGTPYRLVGVTWDISEEVQTEQQLRAQAEQERKLLERLNIATDSAGISSWEIDLRVQRFLWIENPIKSVQYEGDMQSDMALARFTSRILPEDRSAMPDAMRAALEAKSDRIEFRYRARGRDDTIVHLQSYARVILDQTGEPARVLGVSWDITREVAAAEQLRLQTEKLQEAERRLERASLSSSEGHWEAELASGHLWCSSSFHTLLGYREGELEDRVAALDRLVHRDDRQAYLDALRNHLQDGATYDVETRLQTGNGDYRWFRMRGTAERDDQGRPVVMAGSIHDIHQQKIIEDALDLAQRRYERAINGTQDGLWELDVGLDVMWCSPRLALLLGYPAEELEANNFLRTLIHPDDAPKIQEVTLAHYRQNMPFDLELRLKTRAGEYRWYRARASADRDANGRAQRLSGSLQDVTEARAAREELVRATEAAEAASRAKSAFLANVSHEIRTPMNGIIGMTGLLLETELDRTQRDYADTIRGSADSLLTVINDILDFSKIEAGKLDLESVEMDLRSNVEDVGAMMAFQAATKGLEFIVNVHPEVPQFVRGDPQRLRQCLINLVGNAIKFTKSGEVVLDVCAVGNHDGRVLTHFEVRDTGIGIPDKALKTLFQPFVQADSSTTRHFGGTGLGLSIVRRLVEMMGGQVGVVSEVGRGSTFFFTLSLEPVDAVEAVPPRGAHRGRILIVDDNATNRRVLSSQIAHAGHTTVATNSGADALATLEKAAADGAPFDMVVTDFQMPDMDGAMLGERIAATPKLANARLIMLTSLDRQGDTPRLAALGFAAYLTKPVRSRELIDCIERVLGGDARQWQMEVRPMITRNTLSQANAERRFAGRVLVVEDNVVNQKVVVRFLERMGCTVTVADNGAEGVTAALGEPFDIVLMDLQMPVMDGLTATQRIREREVGRRTPIIALTANAMRGDQERCEAAGMDGFLTKPIDVERLRDALARHGLATDGTGTHERVVESKVVESAAPPASDVPPVDLARLNEITDGDPEFTRELIDTFIVSIDEQLAEIEAAVAANDRKALARAAHKLKGACANIQAHEMRATTAAMETNAASMNADELRKAIDTLRAESERTKAFLLQTLPPEQRAAS